MVFGPGKQPVYSRSERACPSLQQLVLLLKTRLEVIKNTSQRRSFGGHFAPQSGELFGPSIVVARQPDLQFAAHASGKPIPVDPMFRDGGKLCLHVGKDADRCLINVFTEIAGPAQFDRRIVAKEEMPAFRAQTVAGQQARFGLQCKEGRAAHRHCQTTEEGDVHQAKIVFVYVRHDAKYAAFLECARAGKDGRPIVVEDSRPDLETIEQTFVDVRRWVLLR